MNENRKAEFKKLRSAIKQAGKKRRSDKTKNLKIEVIRLRYLNYPKKSKGK